MACFIVPTTEAIVSTIITKVVESKEKKELATDLSKVDAAEVEKKVSEVTKGHFSQKLKWLNTMLWGGSALLAFEHIWHGEVTPWAPFLTAAANPADTVEMLHEMATTGVTMSILVTLVWGGMVMVSSALEKKSIDVTKKVESK